MRLIFEHFLKTGSQAAVKELVNSLGYKTKERKLTTKDQVARVVGGKRFDEDRITSILKNRVYIGELYDERSETVYDGQHVPIIHDKTIWVRAQGILNEKSIKLSGRRKTQQERDKYVFLLKGLVHCSDCGSTMTPTFPGKSSKTGEPYLFYMCTQVSEQGRACNCTIRSLPARPMEQLVIDATASLAKEPHVIEGVVKASVARAQKELGPLEREYAQWIQRNGAIATRLKRLLEVAITKGVEALVESARQEAEQLEHERRAVDSKVYELKQKIDDCKNALLNAEMIHKGFTHFAKTINTLTLDQKKAYCQHLIDRIDVYPWDPLQQKKSPPPKKSKEGLLNPEVIVRKTRTQWYRLKTRYRELPETPPVLGGGSSSLGSHLLGSADRTRTCDKVITL